MTRPSLLRAGHLLSVALAVWVGASGCCRDEVGGALVINDTEETITIEVDGRSWVIEPGRDDVPFGPPGPAEIVVRAPERSWTHHVTLTTRDLLVLPASKEGCIALANHFEQYGGTGQVDIMLVATAAKPGNISLDGDLYLGVNDPLPKAIYPGDPVRRFTRVPCELIEDERGLQAHLWALN